MGPWTFWLARALNRLGRLLAHSGQDLSLRTAMDYHQQGKDALALATLETWLAPERQNISGSRFGDLRDEVALAALSLYTWLLVQRCRFDDARAVFENFGGITETGQEYRFAVTLCKRGSEADVAYLLDLLYSYCGLLGLAGQHLAARRLVECFPTPACLSEVSRHALLERMHGWPEHCRHEYIGILAGCYLLEPDPQTTLELYKTWLDWDCSDRTTDFAVLMQRLKDIENSLSVSAFPHFLRPLQVALTRIYPDIEAPVFDLHRQIK